VQLSKLRFAGTTTLAATLMLMAASCAPMESMHSSSASSTSKPGASIVKKSFGTTNTGEPVEQYILTNGQGASVSLITYGATVTKLVVPDKSGTLGDVVLGFDNMKQYQDESPYFGAIVGRVGNRIAKGLFTLDKQGSYALAINNGPNHLHGGFKGYDKRIWKAEAEMTADGPSVRFTLTDPDGTEGYPGTLMSTVIYSMTGGSDSDGPYSGLKIQYFANTDKGTPINLTNHTYWNLKDGGKTTIFDHQMKVFGDHYTPVDATLIPTGEIAPVKGTPIDFTTPKPIGRDLMAMGGDPVGYDHNLVLTNQDASFAKAVQVYEPETGRLMDVWTTEPGVQFYSGNFLDGSFAGKYGIVYQQHNALVLECQHYPDSVNHPNFPKSVLMPGEVYRQITEYRFSTPTKAPW
jgi:aldose 1-epimerase